MTMQIKRHAQGSSVVLNPLEVKTVKVINTESSPEIEAAVQEEISAGEVAPSQEEVAANPNETPAERRARRKDEYREAASIRERALQMQRQAEHQIKETQQFSTLIQQAKDDPTVLAKALGMSPEELQRKFFNKMYNIAEDQKPVKEETFEEQTQRRLAQYEQERAQDKERQAQEARQHAEAQAQRTKSDYIQSTIIPAITEEHEFIINNGREGCAQLIYDMMNQLYQAEAQRFEQSNPGRRFTDQDFSVKPIDVINQMEEELGKRAEEQIVRARNIKKLGKHFGQVQESEFSMPRKEFGSPQQRRVSTLSNSLGSAAPPAVSTGLGGSSSSTSNGARIPLKQRDARREAAKRNLGNG